MKAKGRRLQGGRHHHAAKQRGQHAAPQQRRTGAAGRGILHRFRVADAVDQSGGETIIEHTLTQAERSARFP